MKKTFIALTLLVASLSACTSRTFYGDCIGVAEDEDPSLRYEVDNGNIVVAVVFFELIAPPLVVLLSETKCPVGTR